MPMKRGLGRTYNSLAVANRHLGRGYALAGFYHPRSRHSEGSAISRCCSAYNRYFAFWDREVSGKGLTLVLGGPAEAGAVASINGLLYRRLAGARISQPSLLGGQ